MNKRLVPSVLGAGFIVLDLTVSSDGVRMAHRAWAGGTCGNVLSILAILGWRSEGLGRIGDDAAGACLRRDLLDSGVSVDNLQSEAVSATPIVVHKIVKHSSSSVQHRYLMSCPQCESRYPAYRSILVSTVAGMALSSTPTVFFFDRVSRGVLDLANRVRARGAFVVFEPSASTEPRLFAEAARLADVLKYAHDRRRKFAEALESIGPQRPWMEIETRGAEGLKYRIKGARNWTARPALKIAALRDAAGAGDWVTAGFVHSLSESAAHPASATREQIEHALSVGEALAAFNCQFEGPRGAMYASDHSGVSSKPLKGTGAAIHKLLTADTKRPPLQMTLTAVCAKCIARAGNSALAQQSGGA